MIHLKINNYVANIVNGCVDKPDVHFKFTCLIVNLYVPGMQDHHVPRLQPQNFR